MSFGLWQGRNEDLEREINQLQQKDQKLEEDKNQVAEQYKDEYMHLKTDRDATITQLKGSCTYYGCINIDSLPDYRLDYASLKFSSMWYFLGWIFWPKRSTVHWKLGGS